MKKLFLVGALLFASTPVYAEDLGDTSGPAGGSTVTPSTAVQKDNMHIPDINPSDVSGPSGTSAGAPGIEGKKGTQSGQEWQPPAEIQQRK